VSHRFNGLDKVVKSLTVIREALNRLPLSTAVIECRPSSSKGFDRRCDFRYLQSGPWQTRKIDFLGNHQPFVEWGAPVSNV
jgi:hypothetical protein